METTSDKILKELTFTYNIRGEEIRPDSIFVGYYKKLSIHDDNFIKFYNTLSIKQKELFSQLWALK